MRFSNGCWSTQDDGGLLTPADPFMFMTSSSTTVFAVERHKWDITTPKLASGDPDISGQTAHREFSRKTIISLLTRKGINLQVKSQTRI